MLWFEAMCIDGDRAWIVPAEISAFCECSYPSFEIERVIEFPKEVKGIRLAFNRVKKYGSYLIFIPRNAEHLMIYDRRTEKFSLINLTTLKPEDVKIPWNPIEAYWVKGLLHLHALVGDKYMVLDMNTLEISYKSDLYVEAYSCPCFDIDMATEPKMHEMGSDYWFWSKSNNHLTRWNCDTGKSEIIAVGKNNEKFKMYLRDENKCWLVQTNTENSVIVSYDINSEITEYYQVPDVIGEKGCNGLKIGFVVKIKDELIFFPYSWMGYKIIAINIITKNIREIIFEEMGVDKYNFTSLFEYGDCIYLYEAYTDNLVEIEKEDIDRRRLISIKCSRECNSIMLRFALESGQITNECKMCKLKDFVDYIFIS